MSHEYKHRWKTRLKPGEPVYHGAVRITAQHAGDEICLIFESDDPMFLRKDGHGPIAAFKPLDSPA